MMIRNGGAHELAALSDVLVLLDACTVSVAAVVAVRLLLGRAEDQLFTAAAWVSLASVSTFLVRSVLGLDDSVFRQGLPVLAVVLLAAGFRLRGTGRALRLRGQSSSAPVRERRDADT